MYKKFLIILTAGSAAKLAVSVFSVLEQAQPFLQLGGVHLGGLRAGFLFPGAFRLQNTLGEICRGDYGGQAGFCIGLDLPVRS